MNESPNQSRLLIASTLPIAEGFLDLMLWEAQSETVILHFLGIRAKWPTADTSVICSLVYKIVEQGNEPPESDGIEC